jgi:hypothetical protein
VALRNEAVPVSLLPPSPGSEGAGDEKEGGDYVAP